ncbi:hypothetical protein ACTXT7_012803 [Hymenolepis weldensis]
MSITDEFMRFLFLLIIMLFPTLKPLELLRTLMSCDIADDILKALVELLHPQREIELSKLFKQSANVLPEGSSSASSSDEEREDESISIASGHRYEISNRDDVTHLTNFLCLLNFPLWLPSSLPLLTHSSEFLGALLVSTHRLVLSSFPVFSFSSFSNPRSKWDINGAIVSIDMEIYMESTSVFNTGDSYAMDTPSVSPRQTLEGRIAPFRFSTNGRSIEA